MSVKPVLMKCEEVRAVLDGRKTMMRLPLKIQPPGPEWQIAKLLDGPKKHIGKHYWVRLNESRDLIEEADYRYFGCPYEPGDLLWVRETIMQELVVPFNLDGEREHVWGGKGCRIKYCADFSDRSELVNAIRDKFMARRASVHMPRWASRLTLRVTDVRVERLQDISEEDAIAEGVDGEEEAAAAGMSWYDKPRRAFQFLWQRTRDPKSWDENLWVRVIKFEPINTNVDEVLWHAW